MKDKTLPYPIFSPFHPPYAKLLSLHFFLFQKVSSLSLTKEINFCRTNYDLLSKTP